jgi:hypothetical protein
MAAGSFFVSDNLDTAQEQSSSKSKGSFFSGVEPYTEIVNIAATLSDVEAAKIAADTSADLAATSEANAKASENNAAISAVNASSSAANAATSSTSAETFSQNATSSAAAALVSENNAANSASSALTSANNAAGAQTNAATSAANAATAEANASTSANNAATSATNAHTSELNAATSASNAASAADTEIAAKAVRYDVTQVLTSLQQTNAQANIGLVSTVAVAKALGAVPEAFGTNVGSGDPAAGGNDDAIAVRACLDAKGICVLAGKNYWFASTLSVHTGEVLASSGGKANIYWTNDAAKQFSGFNMLEIDGGFVELHKLAVHANGAFRGVYISSGGEQQLNNVDITGAYGNCLLIEAPERLTNGGFSTNLNSWTIDNIGSSIVAWSSTNGGSAAFTGDGTNIAYLTQAVTTQVGLTYQVSADLIDGTGVFIDVGTTAYGNNVSINNDLSAGQNFQRVTGRSLFTFVATTTTTYVTLKKSSTGTAHVDNVSCKEAGIGSGLVYSIGHLFTTSQAGVSGTTAAIALPSIEPTTLGDRRFVALNGDGCLLFDLLGSNMTMMINCLQGVSGNAAGKFSIPSTCFFPKILGGRFACPIDVLANNTVIDLCQVGGLITLKSGVQSCVIGASNVLSGVTLESGTSSNTVVWRAGQGTLTDNSGGANLIIGGISSADARANLGLGTAATVNTGVSGASVPLCNQNTSVSAGWTFNSGSFGTGAFAGINSPLKVSYAGGGSQYGITLQPAADNTTAIYFANAAGVQVGSVTETSTGVLFNTSSDVRLKEDLKSLDEGWQAIDAVSIYDFKWKGHNDRDVGCVAQELYQVVPRAVAVGETITGEDGTSKEIPWTVDYSKLVPHLIAEVKAIRKRLSIAGL